MVQEYQFEVVVVPDAAESDEGQQYAGPAEHVCWLFAEIKHCVMVSVQNKCTMARNSMADMVNEASDVGGVVGGIGGVAGRSVKAA